MRVLSFLTLCLSALQFALAADTETPPACGVSRKENTAGARRGTEENCRADQHIATMYGGIDSQLGLPVDRQHDLYLHKRTAASANHRMCHCELLDS